MNKTSRIIFSIVAILILSSCYNNSHIRTQRVLEPEDQIFSAYGSINFMGTDSDYESYDIRHGGVAGMRAGISYLGYHNGYEQGASIGYGGGTGDYSSLLFGYDIRKVITAENSTPYRYGLHTEFNSLNSNTNNRIRGGSVFQLRPYIMSTTSGLNNWYGGVHGLMSFGTIHSSEWYSDYSSSSGYASYVEEYSYDVSSVGLGVTVGQEMRLGSILVQTQVDLSYINQQHEIDPDDFASIPTSEYGDFEIAPLKQSGAFASLGFSFSQIPKSQKMRARIPVQYMGTTDNKPEAPLSQKFDPFTGEALPDESPPLVKYDPHTGLPMKNIPTSFDPFTGRPVAEEGPHSLLSPQVRSLLLMKSLKIVSMNGAMTTAFVQDVKNTGLVIYRESMGKPVLETIDYKHIVSIHFEGGRRGFSKGLNSAMVSCGVCVALPLAGAILTGEGSLFALGILSAPVVGLGTLVVTSLGSDKYEIRYEPTNNQGVDAEYKKQVLTQLIEIYVESGFPDYDVTKFQAKP